MESKKICKRCMKKQGIVVATLDQELGVCSFCGTENWVHSIPVGIEDMPELGIESMVPLPKEQEEVPESIPDDSVLDDIDKLYPETDPEEVVHVVAPDAEPVEKSAPVDFEEVTHIGITEEEQEKLTAEIRDSKQTEIDELRAKLAKLEAKE